MNRLSGRAANDPLAWLALAVVYVVWGSTYLAIRVGVRGIPPLALAGVRYLIAGMLLYPIAVRTGSPETRASDRIGRPQLLACGVVALLLPALGNGGLSVGETVVASGTAAMLVATVPLWMIFFAVPVQHNRANRRQLSGLLVGIIGVILLTAGGSVHNHIGGMLVVLGASAAWGLGSVVGRRMQMPQRALLAAALEMLIGGALLIVGAAIAGEFNHLNWQAIHLASWLSLVYLILPGSILAFSAYGYALAHLRVSTVSTYAYVNPIVAVILGTALLHERFTLRDALAALLIVVSVMLALRPGASSEKDGADLLSAPESAVAVEDPARRTHRVERLT